MAMKRFRSSAGVSSQRGVTAVEFALGAFTFFAFVFGVMELGRALYLWSSMIEVTRRAARTAAYSDFSDSAQMANLRSRAMFEHVGGLFTNRDITGDNLVIDYLNAGMVPVAPPSCPARNYIACNTDPEGSACIRFVRVRLCATGTACANVEYKPMTGADFFPGGTLHFPTFATVTPAGTLGFTPGATSNCL